MGRSVPRFPDRVLILVSYPSSNDPTNPPYAKAYGGFVLDGNRVSSRVSLVPNQAAKIPSGGASAHFNNQKQDMRLEMAVKKPDGYLH